MLRIHSVPWLRSFPTPLIHAFVFIFVSLQWVHLIMLHIFYLCPDYIIVPFVLRGRTIAVLLTFRAGSEVYTRNKSVMECIYGKKKV